MRPVTLRELEVRYQALFDDAWEQFQRAVHAGDAAQAKRATQLMYLWDDLRMVTTYPTRAAMERAATAVIQNQDNGELRGLAQTAYHVIMGASNA